MQWAASGNQTHLSLGLRAASETSSSSWRRFESTVTLVVVFNTPPVALSAVDLGLSGTPKIPCVTGSGRPWVNSRSMTLQAIGRDADKPYGQTLQAHFEYWYEGDKVATIATGWQAPDTAFLLPLTKASDGLFAWRVTFYDSVQWSGWSAWCEFQVDATAPAGAVNVSSPQFPERTPGQTTQSGQVGTPGTFTLTAANAAAEGAVGFVWGLNVDEPTTTKLFDGTPGTASVVVTRPGWDRLAARAQHRRGRQQGPTRDYFFMVSGMPHASHWELDEPAGATTASRRAEVSTAPSSAHRRASTAPAPATTPPTAPWTWTVSLSG